MMNQYLSTQGMCGEGCIMMWYGNYPGQDFYVNLNGWALLINQNNHDTPTSSYTYYPWFYYYKIIGNANTIVERIDGAEGTQEDRDFIKAQALTFRAYSFFMLTQLYCKRWVDSDNGNCPGLVLRLDESMGDYPLMSNKLLLSTGFCTAKDNPEWIWGGYSATDQTLYYYSYHAYIAYNSNAGNVRNYPKCISKELFEQIPASDVRKQWWLDPTYVDDEGNVQTYPYTASTGQAANSTQLAKNTRAAKPDLLSNASVYAYMQWKVRCNDTPGVGDLNFFRSSEMYLIEAEAQHMLGNDAAAQAALIALNKTSGRDPEYACDKTGDDLMNEIKLYRRIELWGEGFDWFDLKRWKDTLVRHNAGEGGNFLATLAVTIEPQEKNEWRFMIPTRETDYNKAVSDGVITPANWNLNNQ